MDKQQKRVMNGRVHLQTIFIVICIKINLLCIAQLLVFIKY
jgi:hypothetical protein